MVDTDLHRGLARHGANVLLANGGTASEACFDEGGRDLKRKARRMLRAAQGLASELEKETGLATTAGLGDTLLGGFVIISTSPRLRKPGQWFAYPPDPR